jgi:hypothetical protein
VSGRALNPVSLEHGPNRHHHRTSGGGAPSASALDNDARELDDEARVFVLHTAAAAPVDVMLALGKSKKKRIKIEGLSKGDQATAEVNPGI